MNDYLLSILLGVIEGVTEFLPVSSTAHFRIAEALLQIDLKDGFWKMYSIVIQLGAILALTVFFWRRILNFLRTFPRGERGDRTVLTHPLSLVAIAFVVTAIPAFLLSKLIGKNLENLYVMAWALLIGGIVMWAVDALFVRPRIQHMEETNLPTAIWIGAVQVLSAVFPGTSRSMCTIAAGQVAGHVAPGRPRVFVFSLHADDGRRDRLRSAQDDRAARRNRGARAARHDAPSLDRAGARFRLGLCRRAGRRRLVYALGAAAGFVPFAIYRIVLGVVLLLALSRGLLGR